MKAVRITTRQGMVRITGLPPGCSLETWWFTCKGLGEIVGNQWAMPFDTIAIADMIEIPDQQEHPANGQRAATPDDVSKAILAGTWKPDFKA